MPIPFILAGGALLAGAVGIKKGIDAKNDFEIAKHIGERAEEKFNKAQKSLERERKKLNKEFQSFAEFKVGIFTNEIARLLEVARKKKGASSELQLQKHFSKEEIREMTKCIEQSIDFLSTGVSSVGAGALTAFGAYGAAGALATASTGTAISTLSGVAATNATLAWFGGGSLAAGGLGMAGGTAILGGLVAGPALAVMGFVAAAKADEAYTDACRFEAKVDKEIAKIKTAVKLLKQVSVRIEEVKFVITELQTRFNETFISNVDDPRFNTTLMLGKKLKESLEIAILDKNGDLSINKNIETEIERLRA